MDTFSDALLSSKTDKIPDGYDWFAPLLGDWDCDYYDEPINHQKRHVKGEWIFRRILEGTGIQDIFIFPSRATKEANPQPDGEYGSSIRMFNKARGCYDVVYTCAGTMKRLCFKKEGNQLTGKVLDEEAAYWIFSDITDKSFHWEYVTLNPDGSRSLVCEIFGRRLQMKEELNSGDPSANAVKKRVCFLTSSPVVPGTDLLNPANSFIEELHRHFHRGCQALFVCSDPDLFDKTDFFANEIKQIFENAGFMFGEFRILDRRNEHQAAELIRNAGLIILAGGHVPTQNLFFREIGLRALLKDYTGILIGISAGSMNSAETVYAQPEREGEVTDPAYQRFLPGLGLTKAMLLPHYQENKDDILDGLRVYEDVALPDSYGYVFYAIPDGSYLFIEDGKEELRGEAYRISDGNMSQISKENDMIIL